MTPSGKVFRAKGPVLTVIRYTVCALPWKRAVELKGKIKPANVSV